MVFRKFFDLQTTVQYITFFRFEMIRKNSKHFLQKQLILSSCRAHLLLSYTHTGFSLNFREKKYLWGTLSTENKYFRENMPKSHFIKNIFIKVAPLFSQVVTFCNKGRKFNICSFARKFSPRYERKWSEITFAKFFAKMRKRKFPF